MEEYLASNFSSMNSTLTNDVNVADSEKSPTEINSSFEARNIIIGAAGMSVNSLAFIIVLKSNKVNLGRKLLLLNLIASDIILLVCIFIYGIVPSTKTSGGTGCLPIVILLMVTIISSYVIALQLSVLNFLAVYIPFHYRRLVSCKNTGIVVIVEWMFCIAVCIWTVGIQIPNGFTCAPIVVIRPNGLVGLATITMLSFIGVITLNVSVVIMVSKRKRQAVVSVRTVRVSRNGRQNQPQSRNKPIFSQIFRNRKVMPSTSAIHITTTSLSIETNRLSPIEDGIFHMSQITTIENKARRCELVPRANQPIPHLQHRPQTSGSENVTTRTDRTRIDDSPGRNHSNSTDVRDKTRKALLMLTTYSCVITLPIIIYIICICTHVIDDPEKMVSTPLGIFVSSCTISKACINPFFYVLNFVNWRKVRDMIRAQTE